MRRAEDYYHIQGDYILSTLELELNQREEKALKVLISDCRKLVEEKGYPDKWYKGNSIDHFLISHELSRRDWLSDDRNEPYFTHFGRVIISMDCLHKKAAELDDLTVKDLSILFYPHAIINERALKIALFLFDRVYVIFPDETILTSIEDIQDGDSFMDNNFKLLSPAKEIYSLIKEIYEFHISTLPLRREGILRLVSPSKNLNLDFYQAVENDLRSAEFKNIIEKNNTNHYYLGTSKLIRLHGLSYFDNLSKGKNLPEFLTEITRNTSLIEELVELWPFLKVSPEIGSSVLLNHALATAAKYKSSIFTDSQLFHSLLLEKVRRIGNTDLCEDYREEHKIKSDILSMEVMRENLPCLEFNTYEGVLSAREKFSGSLEQFKISMNKYASMIEASFYDKNFYHDLVNLVKKEINPTIMELRSDMKATNLKFIKNIARNAKVGTVPIVAVLFAGLPLPYLLAISAGFITLEAVLEKEIEKRSLAKNGLSFFLNFK